MSTNSTFVQNSGYTGNAVATTDTAKKYTYSDLNFYFTPSPFYRSQGLSGDVMRVFDSNSIRQAIRTIVLTNPKEKPFDVDFGVGAREFLFEPVEGSVGSAFTQYELRRRIQDQIEKYEPRVIVDDIGTTTRQTINGTELNVQISYRNKSIVNSTVETIDIKIIAERIG